MNSKESKEKLEKILKELREELETKEDLIVDASDLNYGEDGLLYSRTGNLNGGYALNDWALTQFTQKLGIPTRYFRDCPLELQAQNANYWISQLKEDTNWMMRTTRPSSQVGLVRGIVSDKYVPFDDHQLLDILSHALNEYIKNYEIKMWHRDDGSMHLRVIIPDLTTAIGTTLNGDPDIHQVGFHLVNSEVGKSAIKITPLVYRQICTNGMMGWTSDGEIFKQRHIHLRHNEILTRVSEAIAHAVKLGDKMLEDLIKAKETPVENPLMIIHQIAKDNKYTKKFTKTIEAEFEREKKNTVFYLAQAFTAAARTLHPEMRTEVEKTAGQLLHKLVKAA